jgi:hypothetical protein
LRERSSLNMAGFYPGIGCLAYYMPGNHSGC